MEELTEMQKDENDFCRCGGVLNPLDQEDGRFQCEKCNAICWECDVCHTTKPIDDHCCYTEY